MHIKMKEKTHLVRREFSSYLVQDCFVFAPFVLHVEEALVG